MTVSYMDMLLAQLDVIMTDFHKSKCLFTNMLLTGLREQFNNFSSDSNANMQM